jgi:hypothetical protein
MPTDLPYAADAQESLAYDELEVSLVVLFYLITLANEMVLCCGYHVGVGVEDAVPEGRGTATCFHADQVQLRSVPGPRSLLCTSLSLSLPLSLHFQLHLILFFIVDSC